MVDELVADRGDRQSVTARAFTLLAVVAAWGNAAFWLASGTKCGATISYRDGRSITREWCDGAWPPDGLDLFAVVVAASVSVLLIMPASPRRILLRVLAIFVTLTAFLGGFSIGYWLWPAAILLLGAVVADRCSRRRVRAQLG